MDNKSFKSIKLQHRPISGSAVNDLHRCLYVATPLRALFAAAVLSVRLLHSGNQNANTSSKSFATQKAHHSSFQR